MLALEAGMPNCDSMNLGMKVIKAVTMALSAVYDKLTKRNVMLLKILTAALGSSIKWQKWQMNVINNEWETKANWNRTNWFSLRQTGTNGLLAAGTFARQKGEYILGIAALAPCSDPISLPCSGPQSHLAQTQLSCVLKKITERTDSNTTTERKTAIKCRDFGIILISYSEIFCEITHLTLLNSQYWVLHSIGVRFSTWFKSIYNDTDKA